MFKVNKNTKFSSVIRLSLLSSLFGALAMTSSLQAETEISSDGLQVVTDTKNLKTFIKSSAGLSSYKSLMLSASDITFKKGWLKRYNQERKSFSQKLNDKDVVKLKQRIEKQFQTSFAKYLESKAGYALVDVAGDKTLLLKPVISDLVIYGPDKQGPSRSEIWVKQVGSATLTLGIYDAKSNELLGKIVSKDQTFDHNRLIRTNRVLNRSAFIHVYNGWAKDFIALIK